VGVIKPSGFSVGTLFTLKSSTAKNYSKGALLPVVEWYSAEQVKELEGEIARLRLIIKDIHENLVYGEVYGRNGWQKHWHEMQKIAGAMGSDQCRMATESVLDKYKGGRSGG